YANPANNITYTINPKTCITDCFFCGNEMTIAEIKPKINPSRCALKSILGMTNPKSKLINTINNKLVLNVPLIKCLWRKIKYNKAPNSTNNAPDAPALTALVKTKLVTAPPRPDNIYTILNRTEPNIFSATVPR